MATVLAKGEVEGRGFIVKGGGEKKKFIIEDSDEMSPRELEKIRLAAWSMSLGADSLIVQGYLRKSQLGEVSTDRVGWD